VKTRTLLPFFTARSSPYKDPMPLVLCKRGEISERKATSERKPTEDNRERKLVKL